MAENQSPKTQNSSDEIDLGQLFQYIGKGFRNLFLFALNVFIYIKTNFYILFGLAVLGLALGFGLNKIISKKLKTEIIVKPQTESKSYLYDVVGEIQSNIKAKDTVFFKAIGFDYIDFEGLEVTINRVTEDGISETDIQYLELLQSFENTDAIADIVRAELQNKSSFNHRITFFYKNVEFGELFAKQIMEYINTNQYFNGILQIYKANATSRIKENQVLLGQVDEIIKNYTNRLGANESKSISDKIVLDNQEQVNIADLFEYKNLLIRDIEVKKLELEEQNEPISIINFGRPQQVQKSFFGKNIVLVPMLFLSLFLFISLIKYLNKRVAEM